MVIILRDAGADLTLLDSNLMTALHEAASKGYTETVKALIDRGRDGARSAAVDAFIDFAAKGIFGIFGSGISHD